MDSASFEKPLFIFDNPSPFDPIVPSLFLDNDDDNTVSMEALLNDPTFSEDWQMDDAANSESSIDPALLTTFDPSLEPNTFDSMPWDPSTSTDWQPLNPYANIDPVLLALDNIQINHFDLQINSYNPQPFFANNNKNNNNKAVIFPPQSLEFTASTTQAPLSPEVPRVSQQLLKQATKNSARRKYCGRPAINRRKGKWDSNPYGQPRVDGSGCPCSLCRGGAVDISSLSLRVKQQQQQKRNLKAAVEKSAKKAKTATAARVQKKKQSHHRSVVVSPPATGNNNRAGKRKAKAMEEEENDTSESELSDLPRLSEDDGVDAEDRALSDFDDAAPMGKKKTGSRNGMEPPPALKRRRVTTAAKRVGGMPRGLEIQMRGW